MTSTPQADKAQQDAAARRSVLMPVLVALAGVVIVASYLYWEEMTRVPPRVNIIGTLAYPTPAMPGNDMRGTVDMGAASEGDDSAASRGPRPIPGLTPGTTPGTGPGMASGSEDIMGSTAGDWSRLLATDPQRLLTVHPGDRPLSAAEAIIPPHPRADAFMGVHRAADGMIEEMTYYRVPGDDAQEVRQYCHEQALQLGFEPVVKDPKAQPANVPASGSVIYSRIAPPRHLADRRPVAQTLVVRVSARAGEVRTTIWLRYLMPHVR